MYSPDKPWTGNKQVLGMFVATIKGKFLADIELDHISECWE
jgi:hypothetical protein